MNVVFFGTPDFAVKTLEALIKSKHNVCAVVTKEDKPKGRGHEMQMTPVKMLALDNNIEILQPSRIKDNEEFFEKLISYNADFFVVAAYGKILPQRLLDIPKMGCINVHGSLLPKYRGAAPIQYAVINGDEKTGITTMLMDAGMDTGDMLLKSEFTINDDDTAGTVFDKLANLGGEILLETLDGIASGSITPIKQNEEEATYCKMLTKADGQIDWNKTTNEQFSFIRGMTPWPSAYTYLSGKMIKILDMEKLDKVYVDKECGEIVEVIKDKGIVVKTKDTSLLITKLQMENKAAMPTADFLRGHNVEIGTKLGNKEL